MQQTASCKRKNIATDHEKHKKYYQCQHLINCDGRKNSHCRMHSTKIEVYVNKRDQDC